MLNLTVSDVCDLPFPHAVKQGILPQDLYEELRRDFPGAQTFVAQDEASGSTGSRVGKGTGFDIYRGDAAYDRLVASSSAWAHFDEARTRREKLAADPATVEDILKAGAQRARDKGAEVLDRVRKACGLASRR